MDSFFARKGDTLALATGLLLVVIIITAYAMGISTIAGDLETALDPDSAAVTPPAYNLEAAAKLDLRGLSPER